MFNKFKKIFKKIELPLAEGQKEQPLFTCIHSNIDFLKERLEPGEDIVYRNFEIDGEETIKACVVYLENMIDKRALEEHLLKPLLQAKIFNPSNKADFFKEAKENIIGTAQISQISDFSLALEGILNGQALLLLDGFPKGLALGIEQNELRSIDESPTEPVIKGPRDGFIETMAINLTLIRRRLRTPALKIEKLKIGTLSNTNVAVVYLDSVAEKSMVNEVKNRLLRIEIDGVLESNYLVEYMEDSPWSPFPQIGYSERPDRVAAALLEGQVAVVVDNTPFVLLMPFIFMQYLLAGEDYYIRYIYASFTRAIRLISIMIALLLPSFYIAITTFHQELLPTELLLSIAAGRERVPFPAFMEAITMELTFEILREAGVRLPKPVGQATSIVGALVIGNAAVSAGLVSPAMVIVVAVTALASFVIPSPDGSFAIRLLRFPIMISAAALGFYGVMLVAMAILIHLCSLRSFGIPYLAPFAPMIPRDFKDTVIRAPWWEMIYRPQLYRLRNKQRQPRGQKPGKPPNKGGKE